MATAQTVTLEVATPTGLALSVEVDSVQAPSVKGEFGVMPGHLPLLAALRCGLLKYKEGGKDKVAAIGTGFAEAGPERVLLLVDAFALPDEIDQAEVKQELEAAQKALKEHKEEYAGKRFEELQREVDWASARLAAAASQS
jgi:F-type H+-transporting ATPase subunit epsilon